MSAVHVVYSQVRRIFFNMTPPWYRADLIIDFRASSRRGSVAATLPEASTNPLHSTGVSQRRHLKFLTKLEKRYDFTSILKLTVAYLNSNLKYEFPKAEF